MYHITPSVLKSIYDQLYIILFHQSLVDPKSAESLITSTHISLISSLINDSSLDPIIKSVSLYVHDLANSYAPSIRFFESDLLVKFCSLLQKTPLDKPDRVISILNTFQKFSERGMNSNHFLSTGELRNYIVESGIVFVMKEIANTFNSNRSSVLLLLRIMISLLQSPEIAQFFCICDYLAVLQMFLMVFKSDSDIVEKTLTCMVAIARVNGLLVVLI